jgi:predicted transcriptional regulator
MKIKELITNLSYQILIEGADTEVCAGYTSDLLSDVIADCLEGSIWITIQRHINIIAVAQLKKISAIVVTKGIVPDDQVLQKAKDEGIFIISTKDNAFEASGKIFQQLRSK